MMTVTDIREKKYALTPDEVQAFAEQFVEAVCDHGDSGGMSFQTSRLHAFMLGWLEQQGDRCNFAKCAQKWEWTKDLNLCAYCAHCEMHYVDKPCRCAWKNEYLAKGEWYCEEFELRRPVKLTAEPKKGGNA